MKIDRCGYYKHQAYVYTEEGVMYTARKDGTWRKSGTKELSPIEIDGPKVFDKLGHLWEGYRISR